MIAGKAQDCMRRRRWGRLLWGNPWSVMLMEPFAAKGGTHGEGE
jgi:hypothetical protein